MNTTELIAALKIKGSFPTSNDLFSNSDFLVLFNMQMQTEIIPVMMLLSEEYFLLEKDYTIYQGSKYLIPSRAIGAKIRDVQYIDASGNLTHLPKLFEEDRDSKPSGYYLVRNSLELSDDYTTNTLRVKYFARPNKLVLPSSCGQVVSIDSSTQVTLSSVPSSFVNGALCDFVQDKNPYDLLSYDEAITNVSGSSIQFSSLPSDLSVGDWLCLASESPVPMVPEEMQPVLVQSALVSALSSKKDKALDFESKVLERMKQDAIRMLDPRVENDSVKFRSGRLLNYFQTRWY